MPKEVDACETKRAAFIRLLQGDELEEWRITETALRDGRQILPEYQGHFGAYAVNLFVLDLFRANIPHARGRVGIEGNGLRHEHPFAGWTLALRQADDPG